MPEHVIGVKQSDILHQVKTNEGSLTVSYHTRDFLATTVGHILAIPTTHTILWTWGSMLQHPKKELADDLFERYKDVPWKGDVLVRVGYTSIFGDIARMLAKNESVRGRSWTIKDKIGRTIEYLGKIGSVIIMLPSMIGSKLTRSDYYNPFSNTVNVYHPRLGVGMHELGHAEFFNQMDNKKRTLYYLGIYNPVITVPFLAPQYEWKASAIAMKRMKNDAERRKGLKILEGGWSTYLARDVLLTLALAAPALALPLLHATWSLPFAGLILKLPVATYGASIAGHLMSRLYPRKNERFGYVFEGKKKKPPSETVPAARNMTEQALGAHQILTATARAGAAGR